MNMERLKYLIEKTEDLQNRLVAAGKLEQFDLDIWTSTGAKHHLQPPTEVEPDCGFTGCWIGWIGHEAWLAKEGYFFDGNGLSDTITFFHQGRTLTPTDALALYLDVAVAVIRTIVFREEYPRDDERESITLDRVISRIKALYAHGNENDYLSEVYGA